MTEKESRSPSVAPLILVVDDEPQVRRFITAALEGHGFRVVEAITGGAAITQSATFNPDLILLDLMLPDIDGFEVTRRIREWTTTPIIMLSVREHELDKVKALDLGADDYVTKPFGIPELLARIRAALRHRDRQIAGTSEAVFTLDDLRVDLSSREVFVGESRIHLTPTEYNLLLVLVRHSGKVVTHRQLLLEAWGPTYTSQTQYLWVYMGQLRHKLEPEPARPRFILTEVGVGYRLRGN